MQMPYHGALHAEGNVVQIISDKSLFIKKLEMDVSHTDMLVMGGSTTLLHTSNSLVFLSLINCIYH